MIKTGRLTLLNLAVTKPAGPKQVKFNDILGDEGVYLLGLNIWGTSARFSGVGGFSQILSNKSAHGLSKVCLQRMKFWRYHILGRPEADLFLLVL